MTTNYNVRYMNDSVGEDLGHYRTMREAQLAVRDIVADMHEERAADVIIRTVRNDGDLPFNPDSFDAEYGPDAQPRSIEV